MNNYEKILGKIFFVLAIIMFLYITGFSFLFSWINVELLDENVYFYRDSIIFNIIGMVIVGGLLFFQKKYFEKNPSINTKPLAIAVSLICMAISLYWVLTSGTAPAHDQAAICETASMMANGDYTYFQKGEYIAKYPHQLGLVTVMRILFALFGDGNYTSYRVLSSIFVFFIVYGGYKLVRELSNKSTFAEITFLEISFLCLPMYFYTDFVYGEISSIACITLSFLFVLLIYKKPTVARYFGLACTIFLSLLFRKNSIIFCVAVLAVVLIKLFIGVQRKESFTIIVLVILAIALQSIMINALYKDKFPSDAEAIPSILWIAMGTNEEGNFAGWYDGSSLITFRECDYDAEAASEIGRDVLRDFFIECKNNPLHCIKFYLKKTTSQWCAPMYQGIVMNNTVVSKQTPVAMYFYDEENWKLTDGFMNIYQLVIYAGILIYLLLNIKKIKSMELYIGLITIYGGFLFSIIWEAKTRYVFPYFMMMLPYAVIGLKELLKAEEKKDDII